MAVGELELRLTHPLCTLKPARKGQDLELIDPLMREWRPVVLVVGLPTGSGALEHPLAKRCRAFAARLQARFKVPVQMVDEGYSSTEADSLLMQTGGNWKDRKQHLDQVAAQQILETYFERTASRP